MLGSPFVIGVQVGGQRSDASGSHEREVRAEKKVGNSLECNVI